MDQIFMADGAAANTTNTPDHQSQGQNQSQDKDQQPNPLSAVAQMAYDRYGVLDPVKLDLMVRGIFISREDAAALPNRITPDGRPEPNHLHASHHSRPPRSSSSATSHRPRHAAAVVGGRRPAAAAVAAGAGIVKGLGNGGGAGVPVRLRSRGASAPATVSPASSSSSSSAGSRGGATDISAVPSDHEKWGEGEIAMIIRMRAERVAFRYIAAQFPGKNQKAVQEKFYKSIKDQRDTRWMRLYHQLRARHDRVAAFNSGTHEDPIEINSDEGTSRQPIEISSGTISETTTIAESEEDRIEKSEDDRVEKLEDDKVEKLEDGDVVMEDVKMAPV